MIEIIASHEDHIPLLADRLLEKERICRMMPLWNTAHVMKANMKISAECWTAFLDGEAACMYGVYQPSLIEQRALPWMMATDTVIKARVAFYRMAKKFIVDASSRYGMLEGAVGIDFEKSQKWLQWLGFEMKDESNGMRTFQNG